VANKNDTEWQTKMIQNGKRKWYKMANESDTEWQYKSDTLDHFLYPKEAKMPF